VASLYPPRTQFDGPRAPVPIELTQMKRRHLGQVLDIERRVYPRPWTMTLFLSEIVQRSLFALMTESRRRAATACTLEVRVANHKAQRLYQQFGFAPVGIRKNYYAETGEDALIMWAEGLQTPAYDHRLADLATRIPTPREVH
jgi:hypothetical protein